MPEHVSFSLELISMAYSHLVLPMATPRPYILEKVILITKQNYSEGQIMIHYTTLHQRRYDNPDLYSGVNSNDLLRLVFQARDQIATFLSTQRDYDIHLASLII